MMILLNETTSIDISSSPILTAISQGDLKHVQELLESKEAKIEDKNVFGMTPFLAAVAKNNIEIMTYLFKEGANIHATTRNGNTALMLAINANINANAMRCISFLLKEGVNVNQKGAFGMNPLLLSVITYQNEIYEKEQALEIIKILLLAGADRTVKWDARMTPEGCIESTEDTEIINLFKTIQPNPAKAAAAVAEDMINESAEEPVDPEKLANDEPAEIKLRSWKLDGNRIEATIDEKKDAVDGDEQTVYVLCGKTSMALSLWSLSEDDQTYVKKVREGRNAQTVLMVTSTEYSGSPGTLLHALITAGEGSVIKFSPELKGKTFVTQGVPLKITKSITIDASDLYDPLTRKPGITIDGNEMDSALHIDNQSDHPNVKLIGLNITGNVQNGLYIKEGSATIVDCSIYNTITAIYNLGEAFSVTNSLIYNNAHGIDCDKCEGSIANKCK